MYMDKMERRVRYFVSQNNPNQVKSKFYMIIVRPVIVQESEYRTVDKKIEQDKCSRDENTMTIQYKKMTGSIIDN